MEANADMDIESALVRIGGFGPAQKKIFYSVALVQSVCAVHLLSMPFIGADPGWSCHVQTEEGSKELAEESEKCLSYEQDGCTPVYSKEFTSIVTEVSIIPLYTCV